VFGSKTRSVVVDRSVLEAEDVARRKVFVDDLVAANRRRQLDHDTQLREAEQRRHQREIDAGRAILEGRQRQSEAQQRAQAAWSVRKGELRDNVAALRTAIRCAEEVMEVAPMPEATAASAERDVLAHRLRIAESEYATHLKSSPM
jgi:hypothetical protein